MQFQFATAARIVFGPGTVNDVPSYASDMGRRALLLTGKNAGRAEGLMAGLASAGLSVTLFSIGSEPTTDLVLEGASTAREAGCDLVVAQGGGSVIDAGKAVAALLTNPGDLFDYLEVVGKARAIANPPVPYVAVPTTAGTGTEVTKNAVIISPGHKVKVSMRSDLMLPRLVVVDPELSCSMPPEVTAATGLDALTQLIEAFVTQKAGPLTDGICREGLARAARSLQRAWENGNDRAAREDMCLASLFSGMALANAGLGAVHGFAAPIGGSFDAPHGVVCARLLPYVMEANINALASRRPNSPVIRRYEEMARILTGDPYALAAQGVEWVKRLCRKLGIPGLSTLGLTRQDIPGITAAALRASSMKGNPIALTEEELFHVMRKAIS